MQGVVTGIGILAVGVGFFLVSSASGDFQLVFNDQVISFNAPAASVAAAPQSQPQPTADVENNGPAPSPSAAQETPAPTPDPTDQTDRVDHSSYYNATAADLSLLVVSLKRLGILLAQPQPEDEGWRTEMGTVTDAVRLGADNLAKVQPSEESIDLHSFLMAATGRCARVALALDGDLTRLPVETFQLVGDTLDGCTQDIVSVLQAIN